MKLQRWLVHSFTTSLLLSCVACSSSGSKGEPANYPDLSSLSTPIQTQYAGNSNGLLAGLGLSGLRDNPEFYQDASIPTTAELRRQAIHANYTALIDRSATGGFGTLYGPSDDTTYTGREFLAYIGSGINRATLMVQIPDTFDINKPCIVAAPSSGSRGIYGAVATGGAWGLEKGCAVAYTDANKGTGAVELVPVQKETFPEVLPESLL